jgi:type II secretory pathway predicted ATPase ExeA
MQDASTSANLTPPTSVAEQLALCPIHPVVRRQYNLPTSPLKQAGDEVLMRVARRQAACPFMGDPRFGKTCALNYIEAELHEVMPAVLVVKLVAASLNSRSSCTFHDHLFSACGGHIGPGRADGSRSLRRAAHRLVVQAHDSGSDQVVILVDEFGRLTVDELTYLADVTNLVQEHHIRTTTVAFGSCEIEMLRDTLRLCGRTDLIGRFMSGVMQFQGLCSEAELTEVMQAYDDPDIAQFPPGSGWSLTRFFWPTAWDAGHRLSHHCKHAWKAFADAAKPDKLFQIGAEYWSLAIEHVLTTTMNFHLPTNPASAEIWPQAVEQSGFAHTLGVTYFPSRSSSTANSRKPPTEAHKHTEQE